MTEKDLRFAFHMDTGSYGFWDPNKWMEKTLWDGHPTSEYGRWLEERAGNYRWLQRAFMFEHHIAPTYKNQYRKSKGKWGRKQWYEYVLEVYHQNYIFWLEQRILDKNPEVVKNILHL